MNRSRVDRGSDLPRPPTDPDVRDERIRLFRSRIRWATVDGMDHDGPRHPQFIPHVLFAGVVVLSTAALAENGVIT